MKISFFKRQSQQDKFQETLDRYKQLAEANPGDLRIHVKMAELFLENGKKEEAVQEYLVAARAYQEKRLFQIAVAIYNHAISIDPDDVAANVPIYTELANLHLRNGFVGDGVAVLEKLADSYYKKGMRFEATQVLNKIREIDPNNEFFRIKVDKFYKNKDISEEETLREGPRDKWELVNENSDNDSLHRVPAEGVFDLASALDDDDISISISTIEDEGDQGDEIAGMNPDEVFNRLRTMIADDPDQGSPEFHFNLGMAYKRCAQHEEALQEFRAALDGGADKVSCSVHLAECCIELERFQESQKIIATALKFDDISEEDRKSLVYQSGLVFKAMGDKNNAVKVFKKIYETDKNFKSVGMQIKELSSQ